MYLLHAARARLLLNRWVVDATWRRASPRSIVRADLRVLREQAPEPFRLAATARVTARIASLDGDAPRAIAELRASAAAYETVGAADEAARDRYALGALVGGAEGETLQAAAVAELTRLGIARPLADLRAYYPEVFGPALA